MAKSPLEWTRKGYGKVTRPDGTLLVKPSGSSNFATPEEAWEAIAGDPAQGDFTYDPPRFVVSKAYGTLSPDTGDISPPTLPTGLSVSALSASSLYASWAASTDNVGVSGYQVYIDGVPYASTTDPEVTITGLEPSTSYSIQVEAFDAAGNSSGLTVAVNGTTNANSAPSWGTTAQSLTIGVAYSLDLNTVCTDNDGHTLTFTVVSGTLPAGITLSSPILSGTPTTAEVRAVSIQAHDGYVGVTRQITFTVTQADTTPPDVPTGLAVGTPASNSLPLTWNTNPSGQGLAGYKLYRSLDGVSYGLLDTIPAGTTTYNDSSLNADTTYYYKISAYDDATPVANESAQSSAVSGRTSVAGELTWIGSPFPMTIARNSYVDLEQYISDPLGELGDIESIGDDFVSGVTIGARPTYPTWRVLAASNATLGGPIGNHQLRLHASAAADWRYRTGQSGSNPYATGVVWYHAFLNAAEVDNFRWANLGLKPVDWSGSWGGNDPTAISNGGTNVRHLLTDGVGYGGCMELYRAAGTLDGADWWRPFSPLTGSGNGRGQDDPGANGQIAVRPFSPTPGGSQTAQFGAHGFYGHPNYHAAYPGAFDGTEYYMQVRVKMDPNRADPSAPSNIFGKLFYFTRTDSSATTQEINTESGQIAGSPRKNYFSMYRSVSPPLEDDTPGLGNQPGSEYGTYLDGYCRFDNFGGRLVNCWAWPAGEWVTVLYYIKPGLNSGNDTIVRVWVKEQAWQNPIKIWDQTTVDLPYFASQPFGHNALICSRYQNGGNFAVGFYHRYAQIIFSKSFIPWPQV